MKKDNEYATTNTDEVQELRRCGIRYTFVKTENDRTVWKYEKNPRLFEVLRNFYVNNEYL